MELPERFYRKKVAQPSIAMRTTRPLSLSRPGEMNEVARTLCNKQRISIRDWLA
jgi:hypothetical protein